MNECDPQTSAVLCCSRAIGTEENLAVLCILMIRDYSRIVVNYLLCLIWKVATLHPLFPLLMELCKLVLNSGNDTCMGSTSIFWVLKKINKIFSCLVAALPCLNIVV